MRNDFVSVEKIEKKIDKATGEYETFEVRVRDLAFEVFLGNATISKYIRLVGSEDRLHMSESRGSRKSMEFNL